MRLLMALMIGLCSFSLHANQQSTALAVWVNEAIVATYTYDYLHYLDEQTQIAHYFTPTGWTNYSTALNASGLPKSVQKNKYFVSAVSVSPPVVSVYGKNSWQAQMPIVVVYKNPQYEQKQTLLVKIIFETIPSGAGVRGLAIISLQALVQKPACSCDL
jgi:hypothetical protein